MYTVIEKTPERAEKLLVALKIPLGKLSDKQSQQLQELV